MRLLTLTVRNYRIHKDITVNFDPSRNLIGGPNETGKSTLAEAAHRVLFLRSKTGGNLQKEMVSTRHLGDPEVLLDFDACGSRWQLEKRFAGTKGSARLTDAAGNVYKDDEAETKLAEILKCETNGGRVSASQLPTLWAHLWVWQGSAGGDPSSHTSPHKADLVQRLQQEGVAAVLQSAADQRVAARIATAHAELFTATGKPKAGSKPEAARVRLEEAEAALDRARETAARLEQAATDHQLAEKELTEVETVLPGLREQKAATEAKLAEVEQLRSHEKTHLHQWQAAAGLQKQLAEQDTAIRKLREQAAAARAALDPAERLEENLLAEQKRASQLNQAAEVSQRDSADAVRLTRLRHDLGTASIAAFEKAADHQRLVARSTEAAALASEISTHQESLSQLPDLTPKDLETLRKLDRTASQAKAGLDAMATGIELLAADLDVALDAHPLAPGDTRTLTDEGELAIGPITRLRIRPGGGASLADTRLHHEKSLRDFTAALDRHTLHDLDHATAVLQQRQTLSQQIAQLQTRWKALGGEAIATELAAAATAHESAKAEVQRRLATLDPPPPLPQTLEAARQDLATHRQQLEHAEETETTARHQATQLRLRSETASANLQQHRDRTAEARQSLRDLDTKIVVLQETHGDAPSRETALAQAATAEHQTAAQLAATRQALAALTPDHLAADAERFTRAIAQQEIRRREAENLRLIARERLATDGSSDPEAELAHAHANHAAARDHHASEDRRARAIGTLHDLFTTSREAIDRALVQPLADRISGYLQCLFGAGTEARVKFTDAGIDGLELIRPGDPAFSFATLSGGAKEQVAAAVRLALAEILAAEHDGCLPLLFDDAFAYSDPARIQSLQRMLDLAAHRGLQIIILTCTPAEYSAFGATGIRLAP